MTVKASRQWLDNMQQDKSTRNFTLRLISAQLSISAWQYLVRIFMRLLSVYYGEHPFFYPESLFLSFGGMNGWEYKDSQILPWRSGSWSSFPVHWADWCCCRAARSPPPSDMWHKRKACDKSCDVSYRSCDVSDIALALYGWGVHWYKYYCLNIAVAYTFQ